MEEERPNTSWLSTGTRLASPILQQKSLPTHRKLPRGNKVVAAICLSSLMIQVVFPFVPHQTYYTTLLLPKNQNGYSTTFILPQAHEKFPIHVAALLPTSPASLDLFLVPKIFSQITAGRGRSLSRQWGDDQLDGWILSYKKDKRKTCFKQYQLPWGQ